jgi:hypothetical protein
MEVIKKKKKDWKSGSSDKECLPSKCEALSSNPSTGGKKS